jgi:hypothetical protein
MAQNAAEPCFLLTVPLEIRHKIYGFASQRRYPNLILKEYLEKNDPSIGPPSAAEEDEAEDEDAVTDGNDEAEEEEESAGEDGHESEDEDGDENEDEDGAENEDEEAEDGKLSYGRQTKYRHMLKTIRFHSCPPPIGLLQANKQLNKEATEYHRNTSVLEIDITKNFRHFSFFDEMLNEFIDSPFSPIKQVRKVSITMAWDSEWIRDKTTPPNVDLDDAWAMEYYFSVRVNKVIDLLRRASELRLIVINWHDTESTGASRTIMDDTFTNFLLLTDMQWVDNSTNPPTLKNLDVECHEHISDAGTAHAANSLLALRRTEFDELLASRMNFR